MMRISIGAAFLPIPDDHWFHCGETRLLPLACGNHVNAWSEAGRNGYRLRTAILDRELKPIFEIDAIPLPRQHFHFDVCALQEGGFAVAWNEKSLVKMRRYNSVGLTEKTIIVGATEKPDGRVQLSVFPTGEIAIGCPDFLALYSATGLRLCALSPRAWNFTMICQQIGSLVRVEMIDNNPSYYGGPPQYGLHGSLTNKAGIELGKFHLDVPARIVGDTYSHPDHLAISSLPCGGFVVVWTQLGHHLGNCIQAQIFDETGQAQGETLLVTAATALSSVNEPSVVSRDDGCFLVAWSENEDPHLAHRCQIFTSNGSKQGPAININDGVSEDRRAIKLEKASSGQAVGRWIENGRICTVPIEYSHI